MKNPDAHLNEFATRCFRNVADRDYICARMCYRARLTTQFQWSALQAFEKYFKAIFLYNRVEARGLRHDLSKAWRRCEELPFVLRLSDTSVRLLEHLDTFARFRYLETSYYTTGPKLVELDKAIWELRRYCRVLNYHIDVPGKGRTSILEPELKRNEMAEQQPYQAFHIIGGLLESIVENKVHPAREALIWQNGFYGASRRKRISVSTYLQGENAPLTLHPEMLDCVLKYVYLPKEVIEAYRNAS